MRSKSRLSECSWVLPLSFLTRTDHHYQSTGGTWPGGTFRHNLNFQTGQMIIVKKEGKSSRSLLTLEIFSFTKDFLSLQPNLPSGLCWHRRLWKQAISVSSKGFDKFMDNMSVNTSLASGVPLRPLITAVDSEDVQSICVPDSQLCCLQHRKWAGWTTALTQEGFIHVLII